MRNQIKWFGAAILLLSCCAIPVAKAQTTSPSADIGGLKEGWEDIDQRFVFLTEELSSTETSIAAVNKALVAVGYQQAKSAQTAENYREGNNLMDRQGGGPVPWQDFYGKTAQAFFYHSSASISAQDDDFQLNAAANGSKLTPISRPPQLDYIYQANADNQQRAEADAAKLGNKIDQLLARRAELEAQQSALWCKIAFRALSTRDLSDKSLYRFALMSQATGDLTSQQLAAVAAGCEFMRAANSAIDQVQSDIDEDQGQAYIELQQKIADARSQLKVSLLQQGSLSDQLEDPATPLAQFDKAARRLSDSAEDLSDAYKLAADGDQSGDEQRKQYFRGQMQEAAFDLVATIATEDRCLSELAEEWKVVPDFTRAMADTAGAEQPTTMASVGNLDDAKSAYGRQLDAAKSKMATAYDAAISAATQRGDLEGAINLRRERDLFAADGIVPKVEAGWTILFRSADPCLFNEASINGKSYSIPMSCAPDDMRYLRLRRMDTGEYVIIETTAGQLIVNGSVSQNYWWRGDKRIDATSVVWGITDQRAPNTNDCILAMEPSGNYSGWGFAMANGRDRQAYAWAGAPIDPTAFEISVAGRDLTPEEQTHLLK